MTRPQSSSEIVCLLTPCFVLEAMAAGVPVIATKWGGPADYINSDCGIVIEPKSRGALVEGFAAAMRELIAAPEMAKRMGLSGRERVSLYFDWERKVDSMLQIYRLAISSYRREK